MKNSYVFLCTERADHTTPRQRFLRVTKGSLSTFPPPRRNFGILQLSFMGIVLAFTFSLVILASLFGPDTIAAFWLLLPAMLVWMFFAWPWAVRIAFRYSQKEKPANIDLRFREVKYGLIHHSLRVDADGKKTFFIITGRRQTVADAIQLAKTRH